MSKYQDPDNISELMEQLKNAPTLKEVKELINNVFPTWLVGTAPRYSKDYQDIQDNWEKVAKMLNISITQIIIVDDIIFDDNHTLIRAFSEILTQTGFSVRRKEEFIQCINCRNILPSQEMYNIYKIVQKDNKINIPEKWLNRCIKC